MPDIQDLIQAFADGEPIDPIELDHALAMPEGRAHLIDLLVLRGFVANGSVVPTAVPRPVPTVTRSFRWLTIAAAVVVMAAIGGYIAGGRTALPRAVPDQTAVVTAPATDTAPPTPTRVIRFEQGVDWTEHTGGH